MLAWRIKHNDEDIVDPIEINKNCVEKKNKKCYEKLYSSEIGPNTSEMHVYNISTDASLDTSSVVFLESTGVSGLLTSYTLLPVTQPGLIRLVSRSPC